MVEEHCACQQPTLNWKWCTLAWGKGHMHALFFQTVLTGRGQPKTDLSVPPCTPMCLVYPLMDVSCLSLKIYDYTNDPLKYKFVAMKTVLTFTQVCGCLGGLDKTISWQDVPPPCCMTSSKVISDCYCHTIAFRWGAVSLFQTWRFSWLNWRNKTLPGGGTMYRPLNYISHTFVVHVRRNLLVTQTPWIHTTIAHKQCLVSRVHDNVLFTDLTDKQRDDMTR